MKIKEILLSFIIFTLFYCQRMVTSDTNGIIDLSTECKNSLKLSYFLPHGMGFVDSTVIILNSIKKNCSVTFSSDTMKNKGGNTEILQIIVVEVISNGNGLGKDKRDAIQISDSEQNITDIYEDLLRKRIYVGLFTDNSLTLSLQGASPALKLTATSARVPITTPCTENETKCRVNNTTICIDVELLCDGNANCGNPTFYDEATTLCNHEALMRQVSFILLCIVLIVFSLAVTAKLISKCIPKVPKTNVNTAKRTSDATTRQPRLQVYNRPIRVTQLKSPRVVVNYCLEQAPSMRTIVKDAEVNEDDVHSQLYTAGRLYQANQKMLKRLTSNSPVIRRPRKKQYVRETFGREILFLSDGEGKRHKSKSDSYFSTS